MNLQLYLHQTFDNSAWPRIAMKLTGKNYIVNKFKHYLSYQRVQVNWQANDRQIYAKHQAEKLITQLNTIFDKSMNESLSRDIMALCKTNYQKLHSPTWQDSQIDKLISQHRFQQLINQNVNYYLKTRDLRHHH